MATYDSLPAGFKVQTFDALPEGFTVQGEEEEDTFFPRSLSEAGDSALASAGGFVESFAKPIYAGIDLLPESWTEDTFLDKEGRQEAMGSLQGVQEDHGFAGGVGNVAGNIAQFAIPAGAATKVVQAKNALPAALAAETAYGGVVGGLSPDEGETRLESAAKEAGLTLAGGALGGALTKFGTGINVREGVEKFMKDGGYLTPGQAAEGTFPALLETVGQITPFIGKGITKLKEAAEESISPTFINKVAKNFGKQVDVGGHEGMKQVKRIINDGYESAWAKVTPDAWDSNAQKSFANDIKSELEFWPADEAATLKRLIRDVDPTPPVKPPTNRFKRPALPKATAPKKDISLKKIDKKLRTQIEGASDNYEFQETLIGLRSNLREMAGEGANKALNKMDDGYGDFLVVQDAAAKKAKGLFDGSTLERSSRKIGGKDRASRGVAPLQEPAETVAFLMKERGPKPLIDMMKAFGKMGPSVIPIDVAKKVGNFLVGQTPTQRNVRKFLEANPDIVQLIMLSTGEAARREAGEQ